MSQEGASVAFKSTVLESSELARREVRRARGAARRHLLCSRHLLLAGRLLTRDVNAARKHKSSEGAKKAQERSCEASRVA